MIKRIIIKKRNILKQKCRERYLKIEHYKEATMHTCGILTSIFKKTTMEILLFIRIPWQFNNSVHQVPATTEIANLRYQDFDMVIPRIWSQTFRKNTRRSLLNVILFHSRTMHPLIHEGFCQKSTFNLNTDCCHCLIKWDRLGICNTTGSIMTSAP